MNKSANRKVTSGRLWKVCIAVVLGFPLIAFNAAANVTSKETPESYDMLFWTTVKDSTNPEEFEAYMEQFPEGSFFRLAKIRARTLRQLQLEESQPASTGAAEVQPPQPAVEASTVTPTTESTETAEETKVAQVVPLTKDELAFKDCADCPEMIDVAFGSFTMGSRRDEDSAAPPHQVDFDHWYSISRYEITKHEWGVCVSQGGCQPNNRNDFTDLAVGSRQPAINISWLDAQAYTIWLSTVTGVTYRLPSEAEWEYAARAGTSSDYWWGDSADQGNADCRDCGGNWNKKHPANVDAYPANDFGLFGTAGGVAEWTQDCWVPNYIKAPVNGSARDKQQCTSRVLRGGSWRNKSGYLRSASRINYDFNVRYVSNGFRVVRDKR